MFILPASPLSSARESPEAIRMFPPFLFSPVESPEDNVMSPPVGSDVDPTETVILPVALVLSPIDTLILPELVIATPLETSTLPDNVLFDDLILPEPVLVPVPLVKNREPPVLRSESPPLIDRMHLSYVFYSDGCEFPGGYPFGH